MLLRFDSEAGADPIDFTRVVKNKSLTKLQDTYSSNADYLDIITVNDNRVGYPICDLIKPDQESAFLAILINWTLLHLGHKFRPIRLKKVLLSQRLKFSQISLEKGVLTLFSKTWMLLILLMNLSLSLGYTSRMDIIFQNADLAPSILGAVRE